VEPIERVLRRHADSLIAVEGVVGTAIGERGGAPCLKVFLARDDPRLHRRLPRSLGGYPVVAETTGDIRALDSSRR
jgi:hypothetical protein